MPFPLLLVALVLVMSGLGGFILGLSLTPTDMARAWLVVGATLFSGGMLVLALGFAARLLAEAITTAVTAAAMPAQPRSALPAAEEAASATPGSTGMLVAGGAAVLGAGALAAQASQRTEETPPVRNLADDRAPVDEFEQDIFATRPVAEVASAEASLEPAWPALDLRLSPEPEATPAPLAEAEPDRILDEPARDEPVAPAEPEAQSPAPIPLEAYAGEGSVQESLTHEAPAVMHPAVPGLIPDEDLAALQAEEASLAPLEALDVVGAYDSGGVRFTMYSDGSVHAAGPGGEQRYRSLEALRKRLDAGLPAV